MTWAAWRVQRSQIVAAVGVVLVFALWLLVSGIATGHNQTFKYWTDADVYVLFALPGVLGLALGAPLIAGESSLGTNRLAWTQSVTRNRWLAFKFLVGGVVTAGIVIALGFLLDWWTGAVSLSALTNSGGFSSAVRIQPNAFDLSGIVAIGYALFAFSLGVALGAVNPSTRLGVCARNTDLRRSANRRSRVTSRAPCGARNLHESCGTFKFHVGRRPRLGSSLRAAASQSDEPTSRQDLGVVGLHQELRRLSRQAKHHERRAKLTAQPCPICTSFSSTSPIATTGRSKELRRQFFSASAFCCWG